MQKYDHENIRNILTLRYDPTKKSAIKPLSSNDFLPKEILNIEVEIIKRFKEKLLKDQHDLNFKKISLSLSGGIDSGITLTSIRKILPDVKICCIGMGFGNKDDEVERAKELARIYDCDFDELIKEDILSDLPKFIEIVKEPRWNLYNFYPLEIGKKNSDVFYSGDGGDELFGGYTFRLKKFLTLFREGMNWEEKAKLYLDCHERDWVPDQEEMFGAKIQFSWKNIYQLFKPFFDNDLSPIDQVFLSDFNGKLLYDWNPTNISYEKFFDISIKSIFLSNEIIKFATHVDIINPFPLQYSFNFLCVSTSNCSIAYFFSSFITFILF